MQDLQQLRQTIIQRREQLTAAQVTTASQNIFERILNLNLLSNSQKIAFYCAHNGEINSWMLLEYCSNANKDCYLPCIDTQPDIHLRFYQYVPGDRLHKNQYGIEEPTQYPHSLCKRKNLDCVFLPLVAFDAECNRIGMGKGFYDRTFAISNKPLLIGLAHEFQRVASTNPQAWDIACDYVITEQQIYINPKSRQQ